MDQAKQSELLIDVRDLAKHYGPIRAVDGISFEVRRGDVLAFLGPNGAGKTTAMKMITGFLRPDGGSVHVAGQDMSARPLEAQRRLGYLPENAPAYGEMTPLDFLGFVADARDLDAPEKAIGRVIEMTGLGAVRTQPIETLSKGFKRRVGLAQALVHDPEVLILDEPTDGLDPNQKAMVQELIGNLSSDKSIILSTHILDEAERICNRALILSQGRILVDSDPATLIARAPDHNVIRITIDASELEAVTQALEVESWCERVARYSENTLDVYPVGGENRLDEVIAKLQGRALHSIRLQEGRLDDLFREITKGVAA